MTTTYTKTLITDEATDTDSPVTETLMQDIGQSINYNQDALFGDASNSEEIVAANLNHYESSWVSISDTASNNFAHGLGYTPTVIIGWASSTTGYGTNTTNFYDRGGAVSIRINSVSATNITVKNDLGVTKFVKIIAW